jgi:hypothetical protein
MRLFRSLERYKDRWNPKELSELAQQFREFTDAWWRSGATAGESEGVMARGGLSQAKRKMILIACRIRIIGWCKWNDPINWLEHVSNLMPVSRSLREPRLNTSCTKHGRLSTGTAN